MDPLSIATSTLTLIDASAKLLQILRSIRHATADYDVLRTEVNTLKGFLVSIKNTLDDCQRHPLALSAIDQDLWTQSGVALADCEQIIEQLAAQIGKIESTGRSNPVFRRARVVAQMQMRGKEICSFRDKLHMSNWSLQTLLQVMTV